MKRIFGLIGIGLALTACGTSTPDGSLSITTPTVKTNYYRLTGTGVREYVACDKVGSAVATTYVTTSFGFSGTLDYADISLRGDTTSAFDAPFNQRVYSNNFSKSSGTYSVTFTADVAIQPTPYGDGGLTAQGIIVSPTPPQEPVQVRAGGLELGSFRAYVKATSTSGQSTALVNSAMRVPVFDNCEF